MNTGVFRKLDNLIDLIIDNYLFLTQLYFIVIKCNKMAKNSNRLTFPKVAFKPLV